MILRATVVVLACALPSLAVRLKPETEKAFDDYLRRNDARVERELREGRPFLWIESQPEARRAALATQLRAGQVLLEDLKPAGTKIPEGAIHHWVAMGFVRGVTRDQALTLLADYDNWQSFHKPYFPRSRTLRRDGDSAVIHLRLLRKKAFTTLVTDTEHEVRLDRSVAGRAHSRSHTTKVLEVINPGEPGERLLPVGEGRGYLWRYVSYWRLLEGDGGTYIQCEALSLSRDLSGGFDWALGGFVRGVHKEFLVDIVTNTRAELLARFLAR